MSECKGVIPGTFIACGESGNYCSTYCFEKAIAFQPQFIGSPVFEGKAFCRLCGHEASEHTPLQAARPAPCPRCGGSGEDPEHMGECGHCKPSTPERRLIAALTLRLAKCRGALYDRELGFAARRGIADSTAIDVDLTDEEWDAAKAALDDV